MSPRKHLFHTRLASARQQWQPVVQYWRGLSARERRLLQLAAAVLGLALVWLLLLAPALHTLRSAPQQRAQQEQQLARMRQLQTEARALQQQPRISQTESLHLLQDLAASLLGKDGSLVAQGAQVQVQLRNLPAATLANFLQQARDIARALPHNAQLERTANGWSGSLLLQLPN